MNNTSQPLKKWLVLVSFLLMSSCASNKNAANFNKHKLSDAIELFKRHCENSGVQIHKSISGVDRVALLKIRTKLAYEIDQFALDDPYGEDVTGEVYIKTFVKGYGTNDGASSHRKPPYRRGFRYVEAHDPKDGRLYRFTGAWVEHSFILSKQPIEQITADYGVTFDDISTKEDRLHWIAGSSLRVIDLRTKETVAERVGYMIDLGQGNDSGGRQPWSQAAAHACPNFQSRFQYQIIKNAPTFVYQQMQTADFVESVLNPSD